MKKALGIAIVYGLAALSGLALQRTPLGAASLWPASGVGLAALYLFGARYWPIIFVFGALVNRIAGYSWEVNLLSGFGNAIGALAGCWVLRKLLAKEDTFEHQNETAGFFAAGLAAGALSALGGTVLRALVTPLDGRSVIDAFLTWSVGDALGIWVLAPTLVSLGKERLSKQEARRVLGAVLIAALVGAVICQSRLPADSLTLFSILILFLAGRLGPLAAKAAALTLVALTFFVTLHGTGPLLGNTLGETHLRLQLFCAIFSLTALATAGFARAKAVRLAGVTLGIGWLLTLFLYHSFKDSAVREDMRETAAITVDGTQRLRDQLDVFADALHGLAGLYAAMPEIDKARWQAYVDRMGLLERYPSLYAVTLMRVVPESELPSYERRMRKLAGSDFTLRGVPRTGEKHFILQYGTRFHGVMMEREGDDYTAVLSKYPDLSEGLRLRRTEVLAGHMVLTLPVYRPGAPVATVEQRREALWGLASVVFVPETFAREALSPLLNKISLTVYDGETTDPARKLFSTDHVQSGFDSVRVVTLAHRPTTLAWRRLSNAVSPGLAMAAWVGTFGGVLSLLVAVVIVNLQQITRRARAIADRQTALLRASESLMVALLDHVPLAIYCKSLKAPCPIVFWNRQCEQMFGYSREEAIGRSVRELFSQDIAERSYASDQAAIGARGALISLPEIVRETPQGKEHWLMRKCVVGGTNGEPGFLLAITEDITKSRRNKQSLIEAREAALAATRAKSEFLANMSHELRTPLNAVIGLSGLLQQSDLPNDARELAKVIRQSGDALLTVINDILDYSKLEAGEMPIDQRRWDLSEVVRGACDILSLDAKAKGLSIEVRIAPELPPTVEGDPKRVRQVLLNLLNNAVKFTSKGGVTVQVTGSPTGPGSTTLQFEIADTGIGIPHSSHSRLFQAFSQVNATSTRHYPGTGLGLSICKRLVERMGGEIGFHSEEGIGSRFWFTLPVTHPVRRQPARLSEAGESRPRPASILVAEDNTANELVIRAMLAQLGYRVMVVPDGAEALRRLEEVNDFDLVLLDCQMPVLDGYQTAREIRKREAGTGKHVPILALTAHGEERSERFFESGMDGFVPKPIQLELLEQALSIHLGHAAPHRPSRPESTV